MSSKIQSFFSHCTQSSFHWPVVHALYAPRSAPMELKCSCNKEMVFNGTQLEQISLAEIAFGKS
jgi:hypothetical protein